LGAQADERTNRSGGQGLPQLDRVVAAVEAENQWQRTIPWNLMRHERTCSAATALRDLAPLSGGDAGGAAHVEATHRCRRTPGDTGAQVVAYVHSFVHRPEVRDMRLQWARRRIPLRV
jgi:hypothetical protein